MPKYTMLYKDYVSGGGAIPSAFALITDFENLFLLRFCDKEIGFETPDLFALKLESKANEILPAYKERFDLLASAMLEAVSPTKTRKYGKTKTTSTDLPITGSGSVEPSGIVESDEYTNTEYGATDDEMERKIDFYNKNIKPLISTCLDEFNDLFMKVY